MISHVLYRANLSYEQTKANLQYLITIDLIRHDRLNRKYFTTPNGVKFLKASETISELLPLISTRIEKMQAWPFDE